MDQIMGAPLRHQTAASRTASRLGMGGRRRFFPALFTHRHRISPTSRGMCPGTDPPACNDISYGLRRLALVLFGYPPAVADGDSFLRSPFDVVFWGLGRQNRSP